MWSHRLRKVQTNHFNWAGALTGLRNCSKSQSESLPIQLEFISSNYIFIGYGEQLVIFLCTVLFLKFLRISRSRLSYKEERASSST